jgi:hypothetical protein
MLPGRTSMLGARANELIPRNPNYSEELRGPASQIPCGPTQGDQTRDASDRELRVLQSRGCCVAAFYNMIRTHQGRYCFGKTAMQTFLDATPLARDKQIGEATHQTYAA